MPMMLARLMLFYPFSLLCYGSPRIEADSRPLFHALPKSAENNGFGMTFKEVRHGSHVARLATRSGSSIPCESELLSDCSCEGGLVKEIL